MTLTLQATSTFTGLPPNRVGGELALGDLGGNVAVRGDFGETALSQRCRKRVTSSCSSMVFICLHELRDKQHTVKQAIYKVSFFLL